MVFHIEYLHMPMFIKALKCLFACLALCVSASAFAKDDVAINHAPAKGAAKCEELLNQQPYGQKPYGKIIKRMAAIKMQLSKNALVHKGKQSQRKAEDIGLRVAYDILDKQLQGQLPKEQYEAALIEIESLVSKVTTKLEVDENKKQKTLAALQHERAALIKNIETYESKRRDLLQGALGEAVKMKKWDLKVKFDGAYWRVRSGAILIWDYSNSSNSVALIDNKARFLDTDSPSKEIPLYYKGGSYFGNTFKFSSSSDAEIGDMVSSYSMHRVKQAFLNTEANLVIFDKGYEYTINNTGKVIDKKRVSQTMPLVGFSQSQIMVADFNGSKLTTKDTGTGNEESVDLTRFSIYDGSKEREASPLEFDRVLKKMSKNTVPLSVVTDSKLIALYEKDAFIVDSMSGHARLINFFEPESVQYRHRKQLVSVDRDGNIYGTFIKKGEKVLEVFKFSPESQTPNTAVYKTTLKIELNAFNSENIFDDTTTVDSTGRYVIALERGPSAPGVYLYSMELGIKLGNTSILEGLTDPSDEVIDVVNHGQNQLMFVLASEDNESGRTVFYVSSAKFNFNDNKLGEVDKIIHQIEEAKAQLQDVELKLAETSK